MPDQDEEFDHQVTAWTAGHAGPWKASPMTCPCG